MGAALLQYLGGPVRIVDGALARRRAAEKDDRGLLRRLGAKVGEDLQAMDAVLAERTGMGRRGIVGSPEGLGVGGAGARPTSPVRRAGRRQAGQRRERCDDEWDAAYHGVAPPTMSYSLRSATVLAERSPCHT